MNTANIDLDILCHLGFVKNIDLSNRGIFYIQVSLIYGEKPGVEGLKISPVGLFSAPSTLDSHINGASIASNNQDISYFEPCQIDENKSFHTRSFIVRYRHEIHVR
jgi:hypothetical protein